MFRISEFNEELIGEVLGDSNYKLLIKNDGQLLERIELLPNHEQLEKGYSKSQLITFNDKKTLLGIKTEASLVPDKTVLKCATIELVNGELKLDYFASYQRENTTYSSDFSCKDNDHICTTINFSLDKDPRCDKENNKFSHLSLEVYESIFVQGLHGVTKKQDLRLYNQEAVVLANKIYSKYEDLINNKEFNNLSALYLIRDILNNESLLADEIHKYGKTIEEVLPLTRKECLKRIN